MALSKYESTRETTNFARIARAILGPCADVLRDVLTKEISPPELKRELHKHLLNCKTPPISQKQKQLVNNGDYSKFDISLIYFLLRNTCSIPPHPKGWGNPPDPSDKSLSANLERIRFLRNEWGHSTDLSLTEPDFERNWKNIFEIVKDLEGYLGTATVYQDALKKLKICCMDPHSIQLYIQKLLIVEQLENDVTNLKEEVEQIKKHVMVEPACPMESTLERDTFKQWQDDIVLFVSTRACKEVENKVKSQNLVIVAGHSGYGKSTIIKHIALEYRRQDWVVKLVTGVTEIINVYSSNLFLENKTIFILEDPIGKEALDEIAISSWRIHEEQLKICLKNVKLLICCRKNVLSNYREKGLLKDKSNVVDINSDQLKLNSQEKISIWSSHASNKGCLHFEILQGLFQIDAYFPLLCKTFFDNEKYQKMGLRFFKEVDLVIEDEIRNLQKTCKEKYCALVLLVLYNNVMCITDIPETYISEEKFQRALQLCGIPNVSPFTIKESLESLNGLFVKKIGDNFHFYHDLFMEITTFVFGSEFPADIIKYADIGFLRNRVKIKKSDEQNDPHIIYVKHKHKDLGKRLFTDLFGERLLDVIFNPCLRDDQVIKVFIGELENHPEKLEMLLKKMKPLTKKREFYTKSKDITFSKLAFLNLEKDISPLNALIVFCHTEISTHCLNALQKRQIDMKGHLLFSSVCCNGSLGLFKTFFGDWNIKFFLTEKWGNFYPEHITSLFHNFEILHELMSLDNDTSTTSYNTANIRTSKIGRSTPLILAASNKTEEYGENYKENSSETKRNETINLLLSKNAEINLCNEDGISPLFVACQKNHSSTVQLLLSKGAKINIIDKEKTSPLSIACHEGHNIIVQILLSKGADVNLCDKDGTSPLALACQEGHDSIVDLLLSNGAAINLPDKDGTSPLFVACQEGYESTVQLLLGKGAEINLCDENGIGPLFIACQEGYDSTVELLLSKGADVDLCDEDETSPLYIACQEGHENAVQLLLNKGADINLSDKNGVSPLFKACQKGHDNIVQLLLSNGARAVINLSENNGITPLYVAIAWRHSKIVQMLLECGADTSVFNDSGPNSFPIDPYEDYKNRGFTLQRNSIFDNIFDSDSYFSLFLFSKVEQMIRIND
ncbi:uncharacterized protein [Magallana gigas]|uniref:uncharacterized protein isoform X2 n=1 Tax=Magallana gigas TaxID=29159 RepID=UPI003340523D